MPDPRSFFPTHALALFSRTMADAEVLKARVTSAETALADTAPSVHSHDWSEVTGEPTTLAGYGIVDAQPLDTELTAIAGLTSAADRLPYFTGAGTAALATFTSAGRALVDDADAAAQRATLGLVIGTNAQAWDAVLDEVASLTTASETFIRWDNTGSVEIVSMPDFSASLVGAVSAAAARAILDAVSLTGTDSVTGAKTFASGALKLAGSISGTTDLNATAVAGTGSVILPATGTLATLAGAETLTNKTLTAPTLTAPALGTPTALVLSTVETGAAFPGSPYEGQRWYRTDLEDWFYWDSSRSKWLGTTLVCFEAYDAALLAANAYLQLPGGVVMAAAIGWQLPWAATVVAAHGYKADTGLASTFRFRRNGANVAAVTFAAAADNHVQSAAINQDCAATTAVTDALQIFMTTGGVQNAAGNYARFYLRRNAT